MKVRIIFAILIGLCVASAGMAEGDAYWRIGPSMTPVVPVPGDVVTVRGTVSLNHGTMTSVLVRGGVGPSTRYEHRIPVLNVDDMVEVSFTLTAALGTYNVWFEIDPLHEQEDINREGDRWEQTLTVTAAGQPNLRFASSSFSVVPTTFTAGETVTFHYCVMNNGTAEATASFDVGLKVGGTVVQRHTYDGLPTATSRCNDFIWTAVCGSDVQLVVDCDNTVTESNETDNIFDDSRLECDASWHESKNFWLENIEPDTSTTPLTYSSSPTTISADLRYEGTTGSSTYQTKVVMGIVGRGILRTETLTGLTLPGDATTRVSFSTVLPAGTTRVFFQVDPDRIIAEINESDNRTEQDIVVVSGKSGAVPLSGPSKTVKSLKLLDYALTIKNKRELGRTIGAGTEFTVQGSLEVKGSPPARSVKVRATLTRAKALGKALTKTFDVSVSADKTSSFQFKHRIKAAGTYLIQLEVLATDSTAANNTDSVKIQVK